MDRPGEEWQAPDTIGMEELSPATVGRYQIRLGGLLGDHGRAGRGFGIRRFLPAQQAGLRTFNNKRIEIHAMPSRGHWPVQSDYQNNSGNLERVPPTLQDKDPTEHNASGDA